MKFWFCDYWEQRDDLHECCCFSLCDFEAAINDVANKIADIARIVLIDELYFYDYLTENAHE